MQTSKYSKDFILVLEPSGYSDTALSIYSTLGTVICYGDSNYSDVSGKLSKEILDNTIGLVIRLGVFIDSEFLEPFKRLAFVASPTTGVTHIETVALSDRGIKLFTLLNCKNKIEKITSTSEHTFGLILSLVRNIHSASRDVAYMNRWDRDRFAGRQLSTMTIGIIGFGRLGRQIYKISQAFGMQIKICDPMIIQPISELHGSERLVKLETLLKESDIVSIHASYTHDTPPLLDREMLSLMKKGSYLINTARGELVDSFSAAEMIRSGHLAGLAVDVLDNEADFSSNPAKHPLIRAARDGYNVMVTPHIGGCTHDAMRYTEECLASHVAWALSNE